MKKAKRQSKTDEYLTRFEQWEQERQDYIARHGRVAWDAKVDRELKDLYPDTDWKPS